MVPKAFWENSLSHTYKELEISIGIGLKKHYQKQCLKNFKIISNLEFYILNYEPEYG